MLANDILYFENYILNSEYDNNSHNNRDIEEVVYFELPISHNFLPSKYNNGYVLKLFFENVESVYEEYYDDIDKLIIEQCVRYSFVNDANHDDISRLLFNTLKYAISEYGFGNVIENTNDIHLLEFYNYFNLICNYIKSYTEINIENNTKIKVEDIENYNTHTSSNFKPMKIIIRRRQYA